jgi:2-enoate reductase
MEEGEVLGKGVIDFRLGLLMDWFQKKGVTMMTGVKSMEITNKGLDITNREGKQETIEADSIVLTSPLASNIELFENLKGKVPEVYAIGDCKEPRLIVDAIADGWQVAQRI